MWYDYSVLVEDDAVYCVEVVAELVILPECGWQLMVEVWEARLNDGHQVYHIAVARCRHFDPVPCDCYST